VGEGFPQKGHPGEPVDPPNALVVLVGDLSRPQEAKMDSNFAMVILLSPDKRSSYLLIPSFLKRLLTFITVSSEKKTLIQGARQKNTYGCHRVRTTAART
jgi:hypothetical protein